MGKQLGFGALGETLQIEWPEGSGQRVVEKRTAYDAQLEADLIAAAQRRHPGAAWVAFETTGDGKLSILQPFCEGVRLDALLVHAKELGLLPVSPSLALGLLTPALDSLEPGALHGDLVPENFYVSSQGAVLTDFGLARARRRLGATRSFRTAHLSPEQARGGIVTARSEVFSAGLMLYALTCGRLPAEATGGEFLARLSSGELDPAKKANPALEPAWAALLDKALALEPDARFANIAELLSAARALAPVEAPAAWLEQLTGDAPGEETAAGDDEAPLPEAPSPKHAPVTRPLPQLQTPKRKTSTRQLIAVFAGVLAVVAAAGGLLFKRELETWFYGPELCGYGPGDGTAPAKPTPAPKIKDDFDIVIAPKRTVSSADVHQQSLKSLTDQVTFDVDSAPAEFRLTATHQTPVSGGHLLTLPSPKKLIVPELGTALFAGQEQQGVLQLTRLLPHQPYSLSGNLTLFAVSFNTWRQQKVGGVLLDQQHVELGKTAAVTVASDDVFLVRSLDHSRLYRVIVEAFSGNGETKLPSVMAGTGQAGNYTWLDGAFVEEPLVLTPGVHELGRATQLWMTVPVLERSEAVPDVRVRIATLPISTEQKPQPLSDRSYHEKFHLTERHAVDVSAIPVEADLEESLLPSKQGATPLQVFELSLRGLRWLGSGRTPRNLPVRLFSLRPESLFGNAAAPRWMISGKPLTAKALAPAAVLTVPQSQLRKVYRLPSGRYSAVLHVAHGAQHDVAVLSEKGLAGVLRPGRAVKLEGGQDVFFAVPVSSMENLAFDYEVEVQSCGGVGVPVCGDAVALGSTSGN